MPIPMSLTQYVDCFWADNAPYFIPALITDPNDQVINYTFWTKPDEFDKMMFGDDVIATRKLE